MSFCDFPNSVKDGIALSYTLNLTIRTNNRTVQIIKKIGQRAYHEELSPLNSVKWTKVTP